MSAALKLPAHPFMDRDVILSLANGVVDTLKVLGNIVADFEKPFVATDWKSPTDVSVYLKLDSEPYTGQIQFHFNREVAMHIIEKITNSPVNTNGNDDILDGVGEISNIFYGSAKTKLNAMGFKLKMSLPVPCLTQDLPAQTQPTKCMIIPFKVNNAICYVEIIII